LIALTALLLGFVIGLLIATTRFKGNAFKESYFQFRDGKYKVVKLDSLESIELLERINVV